MSDDDATEGAKPDERDAAVMLYDYFKFLTTLSILVLGGVLSLTSSGIEIKPAKILLVVALIATGGALAISGVGLVVKARLAGQSADTRQSRILRVGAAGALSLGTGAFLGIWLDV